MGIPFYFGEIIAKSPAARRFQIITPKLQSKCSRLFLDFNSVIHTCSAQVASKAPCATKLKSLIFQSIAENTLMLIRTVQPFDLVYIAIDGVAPRAKMHQQRKRRFLSAQRNKATEDFKKKHNIPFVDWDSNCITPGTEFMSELASFLNSDFRMQVAKEFPSLKELIISTAEDIGEGEHKMIHYIKRHEQDKHSVDVIYGLDADLIMLSLTCHNSNIVLMREHSAFGHLQSRERASPFKYLVIDRLRESIVDMLALPRVEDYVFICILLGNDFLPPLSFLKIKEGAVDVLVESYKRTCSDTPILTKVDEMYNINHQALEKLIASLMEQEDEMITQAHEQYFNFTIPPPRNFNNCVNIVKQQSPHMTLREAQSKALNDFYIEYDRYPLRNKPSFDINPKKDRNWRNAYYHYLFGSNTCDVIEDVCMNFLDGLLWVVNYYFEASETNPINQRWFYKYHYAPCASDIYKHIAVMTEDELTKRKSDLTSQHHDAVSPVMQLMLVLPPQSKHLLPPHLSSIMTDIEKGCVHYYPTDFKVHTYLKHKTWECLPILPLVHHERLSNVVHNCSSSVIEPLISSHHDNCP